MPCFLCPAASYHDGVGQVPVGLRLQPHRVELGGDVALGAGLIQCGPPDFAQLGGDVKRQDALEGGNVQLAFSSLNVQMTGRSFGSLNT